VDGAKAIAGDDRRGACAVGRNGRTSPRFRVLVPSTSASARRHRASRNHSAFIKAKQALIRPS
jgi:hypothetical protein